ncbi:signal recognition particle protein [Neomoorella thermoacetica]|uniref:Signal recognition particle protein n=3 Tax=Neomoorella thermoacetica TaxID=1525 RepID=A0A1D7X9N0_NEOTH|nr:signal recognition particle protein [Moorella thermoacetica]AKX96367.1 signal recognition particle protein [Moorella thermoacetica]AOQ23647.1 Signal recognition particle protein [Moorella thermoacetica]APC08084.1 signal recognition particle protein [Moorella thermoacetica]OIQ10871.1 signal recognition particle protein [Moorella thermoacetica]OIQ54928.1 signal recognition particle protein [Moorella thermoacetica]
MAVFASLADKLQETFKKLRGKGKLTEADVTAAMREIRLALLEADVNFKVVKDFVNRVKERAVGQEVMQSLTPGQQVVKIVHEELTALMGGGESKINWASQPPTVIMLAGLQGAGKTTTAAKLARLAQNQGRRPLLVAADVYRPAAIKQLQVLGEQLKVPVFSMGEGSSPVDIARAAVEHARTHGSNPVILDTAGRLHINETMMAELAAIKEAVRPQEILLVVDAMTGQDAVQVASTFHQQLGLTGVILTKLDGDTRGGAALSIRAVTGCPIKFIGMGEKTEALETFHPDRLASRILGMGDVLSLIEKAQANLDVERAKELQKKIRQQEFTLEDFLEQMKQMKKMGPLEEILNMLPGAGKMKQLKDLQIDPKEMIRTEAIIQSMTPAERRNPAIINGSRKRRIAAGSGTRVQDVNRLLRQFEDARKLMHMFSEGGGKKKPKGRIPFPF